MSRINKINVGGTDYDVRYYSHTYHISSEMDELEIWFTITHSSPTQLTESEISQFCVNKYLPVKALQPYREIYGILYGLSSGVLAIEGFGYTIEEEGGEGVCHRAMLSLSKNYMEIKECTITPL